MKYESAAAEKYEWLSYSTILLHDCEVVNQFHEARHRILRKIGIAGRIGKANFSGMSDHGSHFLYGFGKGLLHPGVTIGVRSGFLHDRKQFIRKRGVKQQIVSQARVAIERREQLPDERGRFEPGGYGLVHRLAGRLGLGLWCWRRGLVTVRARG